MVEKIRLRELLILFVGLPAIVIAMVIIPSVFAVNDISMNTNDVYTAQYKTKNIDQDILLNCVPNFVGDLKHEPWVTVKPGLFDMDPESTRDIVIIFNNPPVGYYTDEFQIRCERHFNDEFIGVVNIISPSDQPVYHILVKEAGEGMAYAIIPGKSFEFLAEAGDKEKAIIQIANTGTVELDVLFIVPPDYQEIIKFNPPATTIRVNDVQKFDIEVQVPRPYENIFANVTLEIGDYEDNFIIIGQKESLVAGASAVTSVAFGNVDVGPLKIPTWIIIIVLAGAVYYVVKTNPKKKKGRK